MAERHGRSPLAGLETQTYQMPTVLMRLDTMSAMVRYLGRAGERVSRAALQSAISDQATKILLSPLRQRESVGNALTRMLESGDKTKVALGNTLSNEIAKARKAMKL